jgi:hypothetical protein
VTLVAGVISTHNQERWIAASIESLIREVDELVVVDDGSSDGTGDIIASLSRRHGFQVIVHAQARGVSEAYNAAVRATSAEVIPHPGRRRRVAARERCTLSCSPVGRRGHDVGAQPAGRDRRRGSSAAGRRGGGVHRRSHDEGPLPYLLNTGNYFCAPSVGVRRADYLDAGGFPSNIDALQDCALWLELAARGRFHCDPEPLVRYRKHSSNLSREATGLDTIRRRRGAAEDAWVRNRFLDRADSAALRRIAPTPGSPGAGPLSRDDQALLVRLAHRATLVRRGLNDLFDRLADEGPAALDRLGISRADLSVLAGRADHSGLAGLGRARALLSAVGAPGLSERATARARR